MNKKKLFHKIVVYLAAMSALVISLTVLFDTVAPVKVNLQCKALAPERIKGEVEAIAFGNSQLSSLNYETLGLDGIHLGKGGMDFYEARAYLDVIPPYFPDVEVIFVQWPFFVYTQDNAIDYHRVHSYTLLRGFDPWYLIDNDPKYWFQAIIASLYRSDNGLGLYKSLIGGGGFNSECNRLIERRFAPEFLSKGKALDELLRISDVQVEHTRRWFTSPYSQRVNDDDIREFKVLLNRLTDAGKKVVFYRSPTFKAYRETISKAFPEYRKTYEDYNRRLADIDGVYHYDFSRLLDKNSEQFIDALHVTEAGSKILSASLNEEAIQSHVIPRDG